MSEQVQKQKPEQTEKQPTDGDAKGLNPDSQASVDAATQETNDILNDIDEVLEKNAQAFVDQFVQKGGE